MIRRLLLYARTARHLRPIQLAYLPLRRIQAHLGFSPNSPRGAIHLPGALTAAVRTIGIDRPEGVVSRAETIVRREFTFLGHRERLPEIDWRHRYVNPLWNYNLHYFDFGRDLAWAFQVTGDRRFADTFGELALSWIDETDPGRGDAWDSYPISLRVVNWLYAISILADALPPETRRTLGESVALQTSWLERRLEHHIQANHLQKNHLALAVAGFCFSGEHATRWRRKGLRSIWGMARHHVLADGVHCERSPMYHAIVLQDFLELIAICDTTGARVPDQVRECVGNMARAFGILSRPDGAIHLLNDSAHGIAPSREHLARLARKVTGWVIETPSGAFSLPEAGYYGTIDSQGSRLLISCGEPGPSHQPAHAHADMLSFELDLNGASFVVDSGVHGYEGDPFREYTRSTRGHNTVTVGELDQHELWGTFRIARRGEVIAASQSTSGSRYEFVGECSPYHDRRIVHRRVVNYDGGELEVADSIRGAGGKLLRSFLHLHPTWSLTKAGDGFIARNGESAVRIVPFGMVEARIVNGARDPVQGWYFPEFGKAVPANVLAMQVSTGAEAEFGYSVQLLTS